jgi:hypothetical protein
MPLTHINCAAPRYRRSDTKHQVSLHDCLDCAASRQNECHFTYELLSSMYSQEQARDYISTTTLTSKCLRSQFLQRGTDYAEDPERLWARFRGTLLHGQLEQHAAPASIEEARYHVDLPGLGHLSGSPDLLDTRMGILYDYKVTRENPKFSYPWGDHVEQMNVNRWLIDHASDVEYQGKMFPLRRAGATADAEQLRVNRSRFVPVVWNALVVVYIDDKGPKPLECTRSADVPKKDGKGTKRVRVPDIWPDEQAERFIRERYTKAQEALEGGALPPIPDNMTGWDHPLCGFCAKRPECITLHFEQEYERETPVQLA